MFATKNTRRSNDFEEKLFTSLMQETGCRILGTHKMVEIEQDPFH